MLYGITSYLLTVCRRIEFGRYIVLYVDSAQSFLRMFCAKLYAGLPWNTYLAPAHLKKNNALLAYFNRQVVWGPVAGILKGRVWADKKGKIV